MKKLFLCAFGLVAACAVSVAQNSSSLGVRAGVNLVNLQVKTGDVSSSFDSKASFNVGVAYQQPVLRKLPLYLETGLYLTGRGAKGVQGVDARQGSINMLYFQVPVLVSWHFDFEKVSLQPFAGAYYGLGVSGKLKSDFRGEEINLFKSTTIDDQQIAQVFKRSDLGLRFGVGLAIHKNYYVGLGYDLGLTNLIKDSELASEGRIRNGSFFLSLGYNFW